MASHLPSTKADELFDPSRVPCIPEPVPDLTQCQVFDGIARPCVKYSPECYGSILNGFNEAVNLKKKLDAAVSLLADSQPSTDEPKISSAMQGFAVFGIIVVVLAILGLLAYAINKCCRNGTLAFSDADFQGGKWRFIFRRKGSKDAKGEHSDPSKNVKTKIQNKEGISPDQQRRARPSDEPISDSVENVKTKIQDKEGIVPDQQRRARPSDEPFSDSVENVKTKIQDREGIVPAQQRLIFAGAASYSDLARPRPNHPDLLFAGSASMADLAKASMYPGLTYGNQPFYSDPARIQAKEGIPSDQQQLIFPKEGISQAQQQTNYAEQAFNQADPGQQRLIFAGKQLEGNPSGSFENVKANPPGILPAQQRFIFADQAKEGIPPDQQRPIFADQAKEGILPAQQRFIFADQAKEGILPAQQRLIFADQAKEGIPPDQQRLIFGSKQHVGKPTDSIENLKAKIQDIEGIIANMEADQNDVVLNIEPSAPPQY